MTVRDVAQIRLLVCIDHFNLKRSSCQLIHQ